MAFPNFMGLSHQASHTWTRVQQGGQIPEPRANASLVPYGDKLVLYGGRGQDRELIFHFAVFCIRGRIFSQVWALNGSLDNNWNYV